jgi:hypothetical protein
MAAQKLSSKGHQSKLNCVLDIDQTLISAEAEDEYDFKKNKVKAKLFSYEDMESYYLVFERPGLQEFLDYIFANYNVSVWTAASKDYALFIVDKMLLKGKPERNIDWLFFSYHCDLSKKHKGSSKDLTMLWDVFGIEGYTPKNTIILDDYKEVKKGNPGNCIAVKPFEFQDEGSENDTHLEEIKVKLEKVKAHLANGGSDPAIAADE